MTLFTVSIKTAELSFSCFVLFCLNIIPLSVNKNAIISSEKFSSCHNVNGNESVLIYIQTCSQMYTKSAYQLILFCSPFLSYMSSVPTLLYSTAPLAWDISRLNVKKCILILNFTLQVHSTIDRKFGESKCPLRLMSDFCNLRKTWHSQQFKSLSYFLLSICK